MRVVIDPGHGGLASVGYSSWNNARGRDGTLEKNVTLKIGLKLRDVLSTPANEVAMTRAADQNLSLKKRATVARNRRAHVFLSIHFNAPGTSDPAIQGTETWVHTLASSESRRLAASVQRHTVAATGYRNRGLKSNNLGVLKPEFHDAATAACLVEVSFLTNPPEEQRLRDDDYIRRVAEGIARGIEEFVRPPVFESPESASPPDVEHSDEVEAELMEESVDEDESVED